jgi:hypothetical protein
MFLFIIETPSRLPLRGGGIIADKSGMTGKGIIQRSYKIMSIVKPNLIRRGDFTRDF